MADIKQWTTKGIVSVSPAMLKNVSQNLVKCAQPYPVNKDATFKIYYDVFVGFVRFLYGFVSWIPK